MDGSAYELLCFLVWPLRRQQWVLLCNCLVGALPYSHYAERSFPLSGVRVLHLAQYDLLDNHHGDPLKTRKERRYAGCLAHAVIGMFYSVVANQRQPQYIHIMFYSVGANRGQLISAYFKGEGGGEEKREI